MSFNWGGNQRFEDASIHRPGTEAELQETVWKAQRVRALGSRHSFSRILDPVGVMVSLENMPAPLRIDPIASTVAVGGGVQLGPLCTALHAKGLALPTLPSHLDMTVAGACLTATHGSGSDAPILSSAVNGIRFIAANGEVREVQRGDPNFEGFVVSLGLFGVVTELTLDVMPTFDIAQVVYPNARLDQIAHSIETTFSAAQSVSVFTRWDDRAEVWVKGAEGELGGNLDLGALAETPRHPVPGTEPIGCTQQGGLPGPWHERLTHFLTGGVGESSKELQSEYFVPIEYAPQVVEALESLRHLLDPVLRVCELRTVAQDEFWLSPAYKCASFTVHFAWTDNQEAVANAIDVVEAHLLPLGARPHWAKLARVSPESLLDIYPRAGDFRQLVLSQDPEGVFRNDFFNTLLGDLPRYKDAIA